MNAFMEFMKSTNYVLSFNLAAIVVFIVLFCVITFQAKYRTTSGKWFRWLIVTLFVCTILDVLTAYTFTYSDQVSPVLNTALNILCQSSMHAACLVASLYLRSALRAKRDFWTLLSDTARSTRAARAQGR